jgi:hypothetical protein
MARVLATLGATSPGGRNDALNRAAWSLARWVAVGLLDVRDVCDALYDAAARNGLAADDGEYQIWATIRSGLNAGLSQPIDLNRTDPERQRRNTHILRRAA